MRPVPTPPIPLPCCRCSWQAWTRYGGVLLAGLFTIGGCGSDSVPLTASLPRLVVSGPAADATKPAMETGTETSATDANCDALDREAFVSSTTRTGNSLSTNPDDQIAHRSARLNHKSAAEAAAVTERNPGDPWTVAGEYRNWRSIVLHHSATSTGSVASIDRTHRRKTDGRGRNWLGIGYHFVIGNGRGMPDGAVEPTFRWRDQLHGAHAGQASYNDSGIGIVMIGDFERSRPTPAQQLALRGLVQALSEQFAISPDRILNHGDLKATACPGRYFSLETLRSSLAALDDSGGYPLARFVPASGIPRKDALRE